MYKQCYSLEEIVNPTQFKSFTDLEQRMEDVMNPSKRRVAASKRDELVDEDEDLFAEPVAAPTAPARSSSIPSEDKGADYFASLLED